MLHRYEMSLHLMLTINHTFTWNVHNVPRGLRNGHPMRNLYLEGIGTLTALVVDSHSASFKHHWELTKTLGRSWQ